MIVSFGQIMVEDSFVCGVCIVQHLSDFRLDISVLNETNGLRLREFVNNFIDI